MIYCIFGAAGSGKSRELIGRHHCAWGKKAAALPCACAERLDFKITSRAWGGFLSAVEVMKIPADAKSAFVDDGHFLTDEELDFLLEMHKRGAKIEIFALNCGKFPISARLLRLPRRNIAETFNRKEKKEKKAKNRAKMLYFFRFLR